MPLPIRRQGSDYHSSALAGSFCSASAIRKCIAAADRRAPYNIEETASDLSSLLSYIPVSCQELFCTSLRHPLNSEQFLPYLTQKLLSSDSFASIFDISSDLSDRILSSRFQCIGRSYEEIISLLKTRQITEARIRRALLHLILDLHTDTMLSFRTDGTVFYARALGFRRSASLLLHELKHQTSIPLIVKPAAAQKHFSSIAQKMWYQDLYASHLYRSVLAQIYGTTFKTEYEYSPIIL